MWKSHLLFLHPPTEGGKTVVVSCSDRMEPWKQQVLSDGVKNGNTPRAFEALSMLSEESMNLSPRSHQSKKVKVARSPRETAP